jgi:hypothetical protein
MESSPHKAHQCTYVTALKSLCLITMPCRRVSKLKIKFHILSCSGLFTPMVRIHYPLDRTVGQLQSSGIDVLMKQMQSAEGNRIRVVQRVPIASWGNKLQCFKKGYGADRESSAPELLHLFIIHYYSTLSSLGTKCC